MPSLVEFKARLDELLAQEDPLDAEFSEQQLRARDAAASNFRAAGPELLDQATLLLWNYYRNTIAQFSPADCQEYGIPLLPDDLDIWSQVTIVQPPSIEFEGAEAYVSFEGEVSWEPEHGLQLVFEDGRRVSRAGPYDGRLIDPRLDRGTT